MSTKIMDEATRAKMNEIIDNFATQNNLADGPALVDAIRTGLNSGNNAQRAAAAEQAIQLVKDLVPQIFIQIVDNKPQIQNYSEMMLDDWWGKVDEGNGVTFFSNLAGAPDNTVPLTSLKDKLNTNTTRAPNQQWSITYFSDVNKTQLSSDAYAFHKAIDIQQTMVLDKFRTGAGIDFIAGIIETIYTSLVMTQHNFWATKKFSSTTGGAGRNLIQAGTGTNAFECWVEIFKLIQDMCLLNNKYNYNSSFKRMSSCSLDDIVLYVNANTYTTLKHSILSQLYNNGEFRDIIERVKIYNPGYKMGWVALTPDTTGSNNTLASSSTNPTMGTMNINQTQEQIWMNTSEQWIPDNQVWIMTRNGGSFRWIQQVDLNGKQEFANNFTTTTVAYQLGAMSFCPDGKVAVYQSANLNVNPSNTVLTPAETK